MFVHTESAAGAAGVQVAFTDATVDVAEPAPGLTGTGGPGSLHPALAALGRQCGAEVVRMRQVHGSSVHVVGPPVAEAVAEGGPEGVPEADALVTRQAGVALMARAADCVPVLLADPEIGVIGAVHAGRKGVVEGVVTAAVEQVRALGGQALHAWVGPHVCGRCYEVPAPMRDAVAAVVPETWSETSWGTPSLDLGAGVLAQLERSGVRSHTSLGLCTLEDPRLWSFRRDGEAAGRMGALIWMRP
ncbi:polyphenol oxidase family protein [Nocardioides sp. 616]|uniref:polyphenol oxidase family protein n=1 Tax=Nocardioides sp. 616 TaxID=2268090 RepID=UPI000CE391DC|nr:polyphenol oxidase family protein [Nocardioides sp. 616]